MLETFRTLLRSVLATGFWGLGLFSLVDALVALERHFRKDDKELKIQDSAGSSSGNDARFLSFEPSMNCLYIGIVILGTIYQGCKDWLRPHKFCGAVACGHEAASTHIFASE